MTMIVGLKSGHEFVVKDKFYVFGNKETGLLTHVFVSEDEKRLVTVPPNGSIEFTDEAASKEALENLERALVVLTPSKTPKRKFDPNVG